MQLQSDGSMRLTLDEIQELARRALIAHSTSESNAISVAKSIAAAEADGIRSHGLMRLPTYCEHAACGKVNGHAAPMVTVVRSAALLADARDGFAHPAIEAGFAKLVPAAKEHGIASLAVNNSYNCGVMGYHVERLAEHGLIALAFANTPKAIAPWGGSEPVFGTNPLAFAAPRMTGASLVIDQSSSVVARGEVMLRASQGQSIPEGWAIDAEGHNTTDPKAALQGSMLPAGGYKGSSIALMVEILSAALVGATLSVNASSFADNKGGPPRTGQFFIAIDATVFARGTFADRIEQLIAEITTQPGARLPGAKRIESRQKVRTNGVLVEAGLYERLERLTSIG